MIWALQADFFIETYMRSRIPLNQTSYIVYIKDYLYKSDADVLKQALEEADKADGIELRHGRVDFHI